MPERSVRDLCLMEIAAALAGEPGTDHPSCVHPVLGAVARAAYDRSSTSAQAPLRRLAPALIGTSRRGLEMSARLVAMCVSTALASPDPERIAPDERRRLAYAADAVLVVSRASGVSKDQRLWQLLRWCVALTSPSREAVQEWEPTSFRWVDDGHARQSRTHLLWFEAGRDAEPRRPREG